MYDTSCQRKYSYVPDTYCTSSRVGHDSLEPPNVALHVALHSRKQHSHARQRGMDGLGWIRLRSASLCGAAPIGKQGRFPPKKMVPRTTAGSIKEARIHS